MKKHNKQKSFTLIELMTVIGIIAILAGLMLVGYNIFFDEADIGSSMRFDSSIHHSLGYALVGDWKMDDNAANSTVVDTSGNGNDGTFYSSSTEDNTANHSVDGANGRALEFDGVDDYITTSLHTDISETGYSISMWVKSPTEERGIIGGYNICSGYTYWYFDRWADYWRFAWRDGENNWNACHSNNLIRENEWYQLTAVNDGDTQIFYINGKKQDDIKNTTGFIGDILTITIGDRNEGDIPFKGSIDQVRVYKDALSTSQIKQQYYTGLQRLYKKGLISREEYIKRVVQK